MTILEGLNCLPEPYKSQALNNRFSQKDDIVVRSISGCLNTAFVWADSPEKPEHWMNLSIYLVKLSQREGTFYVDSNNLLHRFKPDYYNPDHRKLIFKIRIKRK